MADRGYFVHRGAISEEDLERMDGFVAKVPNPKRLMCGASDVQPGECMLNGAAHVKSLAPSLAEAVSSRLKNWTSSGLGQTAGLGYPLTFDGGEFIQINRWPFANNASCVLSDLFAAAADFLEPECVGETDSLSHGWLQCYFHAIVHAMPIAQTRSILAAATQPGATCLTQRPRFLEGAIEYVMGGDGFFDFGPTGVVERHRGTRRLLSNLKAWLTQETNISAYQGWHDWHADGPSDYGRYHKAYAIVSKGASKSGSVVRERTNVALVNAQVLYAHADCFFKLMGDERTRLQSLSDKEMAPEIQRIQPSMGRPWGLNHLVSNYEGLGCAIALDPGDVLFFREDVWHRTQDMDADRVAIILDVLRFPLPSVPSKMPAFKRRPPQWQMLELHHRLPREAQEAGRLWWHSEKKEESECMCGDAERVECLPSRGYVVARQVLGPAALEAVFAGFGALPVDKVEAQGRVYSPSIGLADLRRMSPSFVESLYALLDSWHEKRLLPPTFSPPVFVRDARGNGSATRSSTPPGSFRIDNAQFVSADPALQRQVGCPECETLECQAKMCPSNFDWHIDGSGPRGEGYHKLWVPIRKAVREHANVMLAPSTGLEAMSDAALRALPGEPTLASAGPSGSRDAYERGWQRVLSDVGCTVELDAGDVLFFEADVYHRTQDLLADRTALLIGLSTIA